MRLRSNSGILRCLILIRYWLGAAFGDKRPKAAFKPYSEICHCSAHGHHVEFTQSARSSRSGHSQKVCPTFRSGRPKFFVTWFTVDGFYVIYWHFKDPAALENDACCDFPAALSAYGLCGIVWQYQWSIRQLESDVKNHLALWRSQ